MHYLYVINIYVYTYTKYNTHYYVICITQQTLEELISVCYTICGMFHAVNHLWNLYQMCRVFKHYIHDIIYIERIGSFKNINNIALIQCTYNN